MNEDIIDKIKGVLLILGILLFFCGGMGLYSWGILEENRSVHQFIEDLQEKGVTVTKVDKTPDIWKVTVSLNEFLEHVSTSVYYRIGYSTFFYVTDHSTQITYEYIFRSEHFK